MIKLNGLNVGNVISEFRGPQIGWNYAGSNPAVVMIRLIGTGAVKVQENSTPVMAGPPGDLNPTGLSMQPSPSGWNDVGAVVSQSSGSAEVALSAPTTGYRWVRVVVTTAGTGKIALGGRWAKYSDGLGGSGSPPVTVESWGFGVSVIPTVSTSAYTANDIMGGLMEFDLVSSANDKPFLLQEIRIAFKSAVTPSLQLVLFNADPSATTKTDNSAYSLAVADTFKVIASLPINSLGGYLTDHGTPNTIRVGGLAIPMFPATGTRKIYALLIDLTGVTLTSTSDVQVRLSGTGI